MFFTEWYKVVLTKYNDTWEQREYRYLNCGMGEFEFKRAIPEYIEQYVEWCRVNSKDVIIDIDY